MALYLKYRPRDFDSLVGQNFIRDTLQKATAENKTVGAYLLCGPRGTGKTSTARILAKAVNCENPKKGNPCNKCQICEGINNENLVDVIEIDAASNTGVDNIREIISKAQFRPTQAKYKIYIIDEVHMLSKGAFNALLKILEEPPEFVKFILATTETHKVPETIISRCQRYDFKNISEADLKSRLEFIASEEKIEIDDQSLDYIVKNSAGGLRNAISTFEQITVSYNVRYQDMLESLGIVNEEKLDDFLEKLINKDTSIIENYEELIKSGKNIKLFFKELIFFTKNKTIVLLKTSKNITEYLSILETLDNTYSKTKNSLDENTTFLIGLMRILNPERNSPIIPFLKGDENKVKKEKTKSIEGFNPLNSEKQEPKEEIKLDDVGDIFGEEKEVEITKNKKEDNIERNLTSNIFDKKKLVSELKELGAKGGLTMGIRAGECYNNGEILEIKFKTAFALKQINTSDNKTLIKQALEKMNMGNLELRLI